MKRNLILLFAFSCVIVSASAQKQKRSPLFLDSTSRKHELQLNVGSFVGNFLAPGGNGIAFDITYARVYKGTHFVRTGIGFSTAQYSSNGNENIANLGLPDTINYAITSFSSNTMAWAKVGYEISIGKRKTRFLFGSDLILAYSANNNNTSAYIGGDYTTLSNAVYVDNHDYRGVFVGLNPRASVRYNFSKLFSGGVTVGFLVGTNYFFKERVWDGNGEFPRFTNTSLVNFDLRFKPELNLIFKIP